MVNDFMLVFGVAMLAAVLTYLGVPLAERFNMPQHIVSGALQFAAGIITALVAWSLMPIAVRDGSTTVTMLAFFFGGTLFVVLEYVSERAKRDPEVDKGGSASLGLYVGILVDMFIDGAVIGAGSTLTLQTGLLLALGLAISTAPLAFVATATAKSQGVPKQLRQILAVLFMVAIVAGALLGYLVLRNQSLEIRLAIIALASGFLITTVTQSMIPEANRASEPSLAGVLFAGGISLYALLTLVLQ